MKRILFVLLISAAAHAGIIAAYDYNSTLGKNPVNQGWTYIKTATNTYLASYDTAVVWPDWNGPDGWRIVDSSSLASVYYQKSLTADLISEMKDGWTAFWTFSLDLELYGDDGKSHSTSNNFATTSTKRNQNDNGIIIETAGQGGYMYRIVATADTSNNLQLYDGLTYHTLTSNGNAFEQQYTVKITYDGKTGKAALIYGNRVFDLKKSATRGDNSIIFGSNIATGKGSVVYNQLSIVSIPEPATMVFAVLGFLASLASRKYSM